MKKIPQRGVYPVITGKFCANKSPFLTLKSVLRGGAHVVQLREKEMMKKEFFELALKFRVLTKKYGALFIINDYVDVALACGADGVHLGQDDMPCKDARKIAPGLIIGVSTHSIKEAQKAARDGADYINIGPVFLTGTKENKMVPLGPAGVKRISAKIDIPYTVMGGIKTGNIRELLKIGSERIAMVTEITMAKDPAAKLRELERIIMEF